MPAKEKYQRKHIRLGAKFSVRFRLFSLDSKKPLSDWIKGSISNISRDGACLCVDNLNPAHANLLREKKGKLSLLIKAPVSRKPIEALARVNWIQGDLSRPDKYFLGLSYEKISFWQNTKIICYSRMKKLFFPFITGAMLILALAFIINIATKR